MQDREHQKLVKARFSEIATKKIPDQMTNI